MYKLLIVEDDEMIAEQIAKHLKKWGFEAMVTYDFMKVMEAFEAFSPHLVLMDIGLPFFNGYHWCQEIRRVSKVPVVFVSSADDKMNIVMAMNMGGDDFIVKPFDLDILSAKVQALLRRAYDFVEEVNTLEHRGVTLNLGDATVIYEKEKVELTKNEFRILEILLTHKGKVVSREDLMKKLWDTDCFVDDNTLTVNIGRLRKKLEEVGICDFILTKKGMGYLLGE